MKNKEIILKTVGLLAILLSIFPAQASNMSAPTNTVRRDFKETKEELEAYEAAYKNSLNRPWPGDASQKQETLKRCAEALRAAIDTNQMDMACGRLTNQPDAVLAFKDLSSMAMSNVNEFATILCCPELTASVGQGGYTAEISTQTNYFFVEFWAGSGFPGCVKSIEKRTPDAKRVIVSARFYESGKMLEMRVNSPDGKESKGLAFKEDGSLDYHWGLKPAVKKP